MSEINHWRRVVLWWLGSSIVATLLVVLLLAPILPPGNGSVEASGQVVDNTVLLGISTPVAMAVLVYFTYALIAFRERDTAAVVDGPAIRGDARIQTWWLVVTTGIVLFLAGYGTIRLLADGAGGGQGPNPIAAPAGAKDALQVQVIAQQWKFTYRWPSYGGVETSALELPTNRMIEFHVTSLDVIHSFWAYQLGVKADANPGFDNIAYVTTKGPLTFNVHCAELCGVWHGYMFETGHVVSPGAVQQLDRPAAAAVRARRPRSCRRTASSTSRTRRGEADDARSRSRPDRQPAWRKLIGFNLLTGIVLAVVGWLIGDWHRHRDPRPEPRLLRHRGGRERHRGHARLSLRCDRVPGRPRLRQLPDQTPHGPSRRRWPSTSPRARA